SFLHGNVALLPFAGFLSNYACCAVQRLRRYLDTQCGCNLEINDELDVVVDFHRNLARIGPFQYLVHQARRLTSRFVEVRTIAGDSALVHIPRTKEHGWNPLLTRDFPGQTGTLRVDER